MSSALGDNNPFGPTLHTPPSGAQPPAAAAASSASGSVSSAMQTGVVPLRRAAPLMSTTSDFPFASDPFTSEARTPMPVEGSPSPEYSSQSGSGSPFASPFATPLRQPPTLRLSRGMATHMTQPILGQSPWAALAASSGAPTPSLEFPPTGPHGSPQLGHPFERLNLGGSWSGNNLAHSNDEPSNLPPSSPFNLGSSSRPGGSSSSIPAGPISGRSLGPPSPSGSANLAQRRSSMPAGPLGSLPLLQSRIKPLAAPELTDLVSSSTTLVLDLRAPSSYEESHLPNAHSVSIPSTLLRRPAFGIGKLVSMLASAQSQAAVSAWRDTADIVLIDQDSSVVTEGSVLQGVASKFEREGYNGNLWFVPGGHSAVISTKECEVVAGSVDSASESTVTTAPSTPRLSVGGLGRLSRLAFQQASTTSAPRTMLPQTAGLATRPDPFTSLSLPASAGGPRKAHSSDSSRSRLQPANPFFDNIRQNIELSHGGITERIPLAMPEDVVRRADELPPFLHDLVKMSDSDSGEVLAKQFYRIERNEQTRLQTVMDTLSQGSCLPASEGLQTELPRSAVDVVKLMEQPSANNGYYPFSITAGIEQGTKNRYKNIWPFDYTRVRLASPPDKSDYINASFVQPRGTSRRYIATQGPMDSTFSDFWTLVWEQDVHVIVMLTKQFEGGSDKCGKYWNAVEYGDLRLQLVSQTGDEDKPDVPTTGFDFGAAVPEAKSVGEDDNNIKRVFNLWHKSAPEKQRKVTHIQCVSWPDFDVPETPEVLLNLMRDVDAAVEHSAGCGEDHTKAPPVLVHCSAGIGRTGSYILVDAITDALRHEHRKSSKLNSVESAQSSAGSGLAAKPPKPDGMDLDSPPTHAAPLPGSKAAEVLAVQKANSVPTPDSNVVNKEPMELDSPVKGGPAPPPEPEILSKDSNVLVKEPMELDSPAKKDGLLPGPPEPEILSKDSNVLVKEPMELDSPVKKDAASLPAPGEPQILSKDSNVLVREPDHLSSDQLSIKSSRGPSLPSLAEQNEEKTTPSDSNSMSPQSQLPLSLPIPTSNPGAPAENPHAPTPSHRPHRHPTPLSEMKDPIMDVLVGMRIQRMSLVQSLRQYLFVHRAIITHYLRMIDHENTSSTVETVATASTVETVATNSTVETVATTVSTLDSSFEASSLRSRGSNSMLTRESTAPTSGVGTDDEGHYKRKKSSMDLQRESDGRLQLGPGEGLRLADEGANLLKRLSFKKRRGESSTDMARTASEEGRAAKGPRGGH